jgi:hypothetical protein
MHAVLYWIDQVYQNIFVVMLELITMDEREPLMVDLISNI